MRMYRKLVLLVAIALVGLPSYQSDDACANPLESRDWAQWRGPNRDGRIDGAPWPDSLSEDTLRLRWRVSLAPGYSGPLVVGERVIVTETVDREREVVQALDRSTGQLKWKTSWDGAMTVPFFAASNGSWIRATPVSDGDRLFVAGMRDVLVCLSLNTGELMWQVDFKERFGTPLPAFGFASSPLLVGAHIYVQAGGGLVKLEKSTGAVVWRSLVDGGGMSGSAFSSPTLATLHDVSQLVVQTRTQLAGINPQNGNVYWAKEIEAFRGMNILTPTVLESSVFTSAYGGRSQLLEVSREKDEWDAKLGWNNKAQGYMSSPILFQGYLYLHLRNQRLTCLDVTSGETMWTTKPFGKYWSMVANGEKILALDQRGELLLISANPKEFQLLDRRQIAEDPWAHLTISDDMVLVRDLAEITAWDWSVVGTSATDR